jgi:hypothetical protein
MSNRLFHRLPALLVALSLAACSGGSPLFVPSSQPATGPQQSAAKSAKAEIVIHWRSKRRVKHDPRAYFISPSTKSIWISIAPVGKPNAATTKIVNRGASSTTKVSLDAPTGDDTFRFIADDQPDAQGNELGGATVQQKIVAGKANVVGATLEGYAYTFAIASDDGRFAPSSASSSGYTVAGQGQYTFTVAPVDVDGNLILSPGTPVVSATSDTSYYAVKAVRSKPNTYTIQALAAQTSAPIVVRPQLVLTAPGADGTTTTQDYALTEVALIYASAGTGSSAHLYAYDTLDNQYALPSGAFPGLSKPVGFYYDAATAVIYVADAGTNSILAYDESGNVLRSWTAPSVPGITGITYSTNTNHIYVSSTANGGQILVFDTTGAAVSTSGGFTGLHGPPVGLAYMADSIESGEDASVVIQPNTIAVVESGDPGYFDVYGDNGTYYSDLSTTLTNVSTGAAINPTGIGVAYAGGVRGNNPNAYWVSGAAVGEATPYVAMVCYWPQEFSCPGYNVAYMAGNQNTNVVLSMVGGSTSTDISAPTSIVTNPVTDNFYVVNGAGGVPNGGLSGFNGGACVNSQCPAQGPPPLFLGIQSIPGEVPVIGPPGGVSNFTAATFTSF